MSWVKVLPVLTLILAISDSWEIFKRDIEKNIAKESVLLDQAVSRDAALHFNNTIDPETLVSVNITQMIANGWNTTVDRAQQSLDATLNATRKVYQEKLERWRRSRNATLMNHSLLNEQSRTVKNITAAARTANEVIDAIILEIEQSQCIHNSTFCHTDSSVIMILLDEKLVKAKESAAATESNLDFAISRFKNLSETLRLSREYEERDKAAAEEALQHLLAEEAKAKDRSMFLQIQRAAAAVNSLKLRILNLTMQIEALNKSNISAANSLSSLESERSQLLSEVKKLQQEQTKECEVQVQKIRQIIAFESEKFKNLSLNMSIIRNEAETCQSLLQGSISALAFQKETEPVKLGNLTESCQDIETSYSQVKVDLEYFVSIAPLPWFRPSAMVHYFVLTAMSFLYQFWILLCSASVFLCILFSFVRPNLNGIPAYVEEVLDRFGFDWYVFWVLATSFAPGKWNWSVAWLFISQLFSSYLVTHTRKHRIRKGTIISHPMPLPEIDCDRKNRSPLVLTIKVIKGALFAAALESNGFADPYVEIESSGIGVKKDVQKTATISKTRNPVWNQEFTFEFLDCRYAQINFEMMDQNLISKDAQIGSLAVQLSDIFSLTPPNLECAHTYPLRKQEGGRTYANLSVELKYHYKSKSNSDSKSSAQLDRLAYSVGNGKADAAFWDFINRCCPSLLKVLQESRSLERGDHFLAGTIITYSMGYCGLDVGLLVPLALFLSKLESLNIALNVQKVLGNMAENDERLKSLQRWQTTSALKELKIPTESLPLLLDLVRACVPQTLVDVHAQSLAGILEHFWSCYSDWLTGFVSNLVENLVGGLIVEEIIPGMTGPLMKNMVALSAEAKNYPKSRDKILVSVISADGIEAADLFTNSSDPFVVVVLNTNGKPGQTCKTKVIPKTLNPVWDQPPFEFARDSDSEQTFVFRIYDDDNFRNELLGVVKVDCNQIYKKMDETVTNMFTEVYCADQRESKQKRIKLKVSFQVNRAVGLPPPKDLENRLQFLDCDIVWDPCGLKAKVTYKPLGVKVNLSITKIVMPARVVLEWKSLPPGDVPTLEKVKLNYTKLTGKDRADATEEDFFEALREASSRYASFPNMDRVWLCMTERPLFSVELKSNVLGDVEKLMSMMSMGSLDLESMISDQVYALFPMCVYDSVKLTAALANDDTRPQGRLNAILDPARAGTNLRRADIRISAKRAKFEHCASTYCVIRFGKSKFEGSPCPGSCMISHVTWNSRQAVLQQRKSWRIRDLDREQISIEIWGKKAPSFDRNGKLEESSFDQLIAAKQMRMMDFVANFSILYDKPATAAKIDLSYDNPVKNSKEKKLTEKKLNARIVLDVEIITSPYAEEQVVPRRSLSDWQGTELNSRHGSLVVGWTWLAEEHQGHSDNPRLSVEICKEPSTAPCLASVKGTAMKKNDSTDFPSMGGRCHFEIDSNPAAHVVDFVLDDTRMAFISNAEKNRLRIRLGDLREASDVMDHFFQLDGGFSSHPVRADSVDKLLVQVDFVPFLQNTQPKITLTVKRAHSIPWTTEKPLPAYSQVEITRRSLEGSEKQTEPKENPSGPRFNREDEGPQIQKTEDSLSDHINPVWTTQNVQQLYVTPNLLLPRQDFEQVVRLSLWQRQGNGGNPIQLGFHESSVRLLYKEHHMKVAGTEIIFPIRSDNTDAEKFPRKFASFLIGNLDFDGDWSMAYDLQTKSQSEIDAAENVQKQAKAEAKERASECNGFSLRQKPMAE